MHSLSRRGRALVETPPLAPYILEHFTRFEQAWDVELRPDGYVPLCIAENKRRASDLLECLAKYRDVPAHVLGYDAMIGNLEFRKNLAAFLSRTVLGRTVSAENLVLLAGAGSILEVLFYVLADPGEGVLVPTPSYAGFWADLETRDELKIVRVDTVSDEDFTLTVERLERAVASADVPIRALLFTTPDNPLGRVHSRETLTQVLQWAESKKIHVVFDEVYALSVFGEQPFVSAASLRAELGPYVHLVWAFSKDFGASGMRCGVAISENESVVQAMDQLAYWASCSGHSQWLLSQFVADTPAVDGWVRRMKDDLASTYASVTAALDAQGIPYVPASAAFFLICDLRRFMHEPTREGERQIWRRLIDEANVNLTPGESCRIAEPGFFRLCYAGAELRGVEVAIERIGRVLQR